MEYGGVFVWEFGVLFGVLVVGGGFEEVVENWGGGGRVGGVRFWVVVKIIYRMNSKKNNINLI